eukprot:Rmarinus@m.21014
MATPFERILAQLALITNVPPSQMISFWRKWGTAIVIVFATTLIYIILSKRTTPQQTPDAGRQRRRTVSSSRSTPSDQSVVARAGSHLLGGLSSVTISTVGVLFSEVTRNGCHWVDENGVAALKRLVRASNVYLISQVDDDDSEAHVRTCLKEAGLFDAGLDPKKVLFCSTVLGKSAIARQLDPALHIEKSPEVVLELQPYLHMLALVQSPASPHTPASNDSNPSFRSNVIRVPTFSNLFVEAS